MDHVGFGSDFDGALILKALGDVAGLPAWSPPCATGATTTALAKLAHGNWLRVLRDTWSS